ncbi:MAG: T9SS type A sorting domain-containing protein [Bacteroidia bacterium]|nr:T9SS type A sorting domain-containing protein [Bacteroidia bacterium]
MRYLILILFTALHSQLTNAQGSWSVAGPFPLPVRSGAVSFSIGAKGYVCTGLESQLKNDTWEFDTLSNGWTQKANFPGTARDSAVGFSIDSLGYIGLGGDGTGYQSDFYKYSPATNTWQAIAAFPGTLRSDAVGCSASGLGFVMFGRYNAQTPFDQWKYDPVADNWTQIANYPGSPTDNGTAFTIGSNLYYYQFLGNPNFYEYSPVANTWSPKAFANFGLAHSVGYSIGTLGYVATGGSRDVYEYNSVSDSWSMITPYAISGYTTSRAIGFSIGNFGYVGLGDSTIAYIPSMNFWKYTPCSIPTPSISPSGTVDLCLGDSVLLTSSASSGNQWYLNSSPISGATGTTYYASQNGTYTVRSGCSGMSTPFNINQISNSIQPPICLVTVDSLSQYNVIMWDKTGYNNVDSFIVFREITTNNYQPIGRVSFDSLSLFIDTTSTLYFPNTGNPNTGTYRYKLGAVDTCRNLGQLGPYHNTIYISNNAGTFSWTQLYTIEGSGNPVNAYVLMRDDFSNGNWQAINSVAGTQQTIIDPAYAAWVATASWRVQTLWNISCVPARLDLNTQIVTTSRSNVIGISSSADVNEWGELVLVFPNPASDFVEVKLSGLRLRSLQVTDITGQLIINSEYSRVETGALSSGIYLLKIIADEGTVQKRIVINH